jgi:hypothetical protein
MNADANILASVAKVEAAAAFLTSPFLVAQLLEGMHAAVISAHSPWLNRKDAAAYARCSTSEIDRVSNPKDAVEARFPILKKHMRGGSPVFERAQIDDAIRSGRWTPAKDKK